ncbi:MAG: RNA polymerase sigma factor [Chloroflexota bacterium]|nr:RNA polymerase sigma factor [Chloroflexota bacterium]
MPRGVSPHVDLPPFQSLIDDHASELHRFLVASVGPTDAEDCLQETFISALRAYPRLRHGDHLRAWLYTIAQRKATDLIRRRARHRAGNLDDADPAQLASAAPGVLDDGLWRSVRTLPPKQRAAVVHRFVFDLAYAQIAERMGVSEEAARQNVSAGLRRLRMEVTS